MSRPIFLECLEPRVLLTSAPVVIAPLAPVTVDYGAPNASVNLLAHFSDSGTGTVYRFNSTLGAFDVEFYDAQTPLTVANFRTYADLGDYTNSIIHRSVAGFIIQGGGFTFHDSDFYAVDARDPVQNEPGISNVRGTIAMAKLDGQPNSATSEWFINLADNSANLDSQNGGFTVFGHVLGAGMNVVDAIAALPTYDASAIFSAFTDLPLHNYSGPPLTQDNFALFRSISEIDPNGLLAFAVTGNTNPALVSTSIDAAGRLTLGWQPGASGQSDITVRATDFNGATVDSTFTVTVNPQPMLSVDDVSVVEGDAGTVNAVFTVTLSMPNPGGVTVQYATAPGTATAGTDYTSVSGTLTFGAAETTKTVSVPVRGDLLIEPDETFTVNLSNPTGAVLLDPQGVGTILDDDFAAFSGTIDASRIATLLPTDPKAGVIKRLTGVLQNTGKSVAVGTIAVDLYASANQTYDAGVDTKLATINLPVMLAPGESTRCTFSSVVAPVLPAGPYYLVANVDPADVILKASEPESVVVSATTVQWLAPRKDLAGSFARAKPPVAVRFGDPRIGSIAKLSLGVTNLGNVPAAGTITIDLYASSDTTLDRGADHKLATLTLAVNIAAGRTATITFPAFAVTNITPGAYYLIADIDPTNVIGDADMANNVARAAGTILWLAP